MARRDGEETDVDSARKKRRKDPGDTTRGTAGETTEAEIALMGLDGEILGDRFLVGRLGGTCRG
jgi:hypothetical protein